MDWLSNIPLIGSPAVTLVAFVLVMGIVVSIHEYGHYIVGRWVGIHAEVFSLGFGKVLWSRVDKRGTLWQVAAIPLGGYVKFLGDRDAASSGESEAMKDMNAYDRRRSFPAAQLWRRAVTVLAGPVFNFILSLVVFTGLVLWQGVATEQPTVGEISPLPFENPLQSGDVIMQVNGQNVTSYQDLSVISNGLRDTALGESINLTVMRGEETQSLVVPYFFVPLVTNVTPFSPAYNAGIKIGDVIVEAEGAAITSFNELRAIVEASENLEIGLKVWRSGQFLDLAMAPKLTDHQNPAGEFEKRILIGVGGNFYFGPEAVTPSFVDAVGIGAGRVYWVLTSSLNGLKHIILGNISVDNLQGPIGIARVSGIAAKISLPSFISLIAVISTAIGMLNLFPIPVLDGGHLATYAYEALRGKPPNPRFMQTLMAIGFVLLLSMMLLATYNDIMRI